MLLVKNVRLSYPSLFKPSGFEGQEPKFNATFLIEKGSDTAKAIDAEIKRVAKEGFGDKAKAILDKQNAGDRRLLKDGDEKLNKDGEQAEGYSDHWYLKATNKSKVKVVDRDRSELCEEDGKPYGGCYVNVQLDFWAQKNKFGNFINVKLLAVQFWEDGDSFGGASQADISAFEAIEDSFDNGDEPW